MAENFNPLEDERKTLMKQRRSLKSKFKRAERELESARGFDAAATEQRISELENEYQTAEAEFENRSKQVAWRKRAVSDAKAALGRARDQARVGWDVWNWLSKEKAEARRDVEEKQKALNDASKRLAQVTSEASKEQAQLKSLKEQLETAKQEFHEFSQLRPIASLENEMRLLEAQLAELNDTIDEVTKRKKMVDGAIEPLLLELRDAESLVARLGEAESKLESKIHSLGKKIRRADRLDEDLSDADNSYQRRMIHQECERELGMGSPGKAARKFRDRKCSTERDLEDARRQRIQRQRDVDKLRERIRQKAEEASRVISRVIIDGMNLCYEGSRFVGLRILRALVPLLTPRFEVTIVFDSGIRHLLPLSGEEGIRDDLHPANVFILQSNEKADETILDLAQNSSTWVISNDRFGDFPDKDAVQQGRRIAPKIIDGRLLIHELEVDTIY